MLLTELFLLKCVCLIFLSMEEKNVFQEWGAGEDILTLKSCDISKIYFLLSKCLKIVHWEHKISIHKYNKIFFETYFLRGNFGQNKCVIYMLRSWVTVNLISSGLICDLPVKIFFKLLALCVLEGSMVLNYTKVRWTPSEESKMPWRVKSWIKS